jgi:IPT/TIG domain
MTLRRSALLTLLLILPVVGLPAADEQAPSALVLPRRLVAGQPATLAVIAAGGRLLPGVVVECPGGKNVTTDTTGRAFFIAPAGPGVSRAKIPGTQIRAAAIIQPPEPPVLIELTQVPKIVSLHDRFSVRGRGFRGEADRNRVQLGGQTALVLAASPVTLVVLPGPGTAPGPASVVVNVGGAEASAPLGLVAVEFDAAHPLAPKKKGSLVVRVRGTEEPLELEVQNLSPGTLRFAHGDFERVPTRGGADNRAEISVKGIAAGDFSFRVRLLTPLAGPPDTEAAREFLTAAREAAPELGRRLEMLIQRLEKHPPEAARVEGELERILAKQPGGDSRVLLQAALDALQNR